MNHRESLEKELRKLHADAKVKNERDAERCDERFMEWGELFLKVEWDRWKNEIVKREREILEGKDLLREVYAYSVRPQSACFIINMKLSPLIVAEIQTEYQDHQNSDDDAGDLNGMSGPHNKVKIVDRKFKIVWKEV